MHVCLVVALLLGAVSKGQQAYEALDFVQAAKLSKKELRVGAPDELATRQRIVLAWYQAGNRDEAVKEWHALVERFAAFAFDDGEVLPETIAFFETHRPIKVAPASQPRVIVTPQPEQPKWRWYYMAPLGVGQFLAKSPVRGAIFAVLQAGLVAADVAMYVVFSQQVDNRATAINPRATTQLQTAMNVVFFSMLGSFVAGLIDGVFFEP